MNKTLVFLLLPCIVAFVVAQYGQYGYPGYGSLGYGSPLGAAANGYAYGQYRTRNNAQLYIFGFLFFFLLFYLFNGTGGISG